LKARAEAAQTKTKLNRAMSSLGDDNSKRGFERMEEKVLAYEAEADTSEELSVDSETLDDELAKLDDDEIEDRKSTRLNSSHVSISYAVFCLKKKKIKTNTVTSSNEE